MLFMPMVTSYAAGLIISILLFIGGLYKFVNSIINRNFLSKPVLSIIFKKVLVKCKQPCYTESIETKTGTNAAKTVVSGTAAQKGRCENRCLP